MRRRIAASIIVSAGLWAAMCADAPAAAKSDWDEFKVKREAVFEFDQKPTVTRNGDRVTIEFAARGFCDAAVAIEDTNGKIVRHLAGGVLGPNAPEPFQKDSKQQKIVWDGKDDRGFYVDDKSRIVVRVALGLKPRYERTLFWEPHKTTACDVTSNFGGVFGDDQPIFRAAPEGVYVYDGGWAVDHVRLFDHDGNYLRTVYPFPADKIEQVKGLLWKTLPPDGQKVPIRQGSQQGTFLTSGTSTTIPSYDPKSGEFKHPSQGKGDAHFGQFGRAATAFAVRNGRIALASLKLNRLLTDGTTGEFMLEGPTVCFKTDPSTLVARTMSVASSAAIDDGRFSLGYLQPLRAALSPDGKWLYLTRYAKTFSANYVVSTSCWDPVVTRMPYDGSEPPQAFLGDPGRPGNDNAHFGMPAGIDCDNEGRLYVADYYNGRVQIFSPDGKFLQSIPVEQPAEVVVHKKTGEIYVFCWPLCVPNMKGFDLARIKGEKQKFALEKFAALPDARRLATFQLPMPRAESRGGEIRQAEVDSWSTPTRIWLAPGAVGDNSTETIMVEERGNTLEIRKDFRAEVRKAIVRSKVPDWYVQKLYVNPATEKLYLAEGAYAFGSVLEIDPDSGRVKQVALPVAAEDMCFDLAGAVYLRAHTAVVRYDPGNWREIPWDYGEEMTLGKQTIRSALPLPSNMAWHQGGIGVSAKGHLAVGCLYALDKATLALKSRGQTMDVAGGQKYQPTFYPGRNTEYNCGAMYVHVWDAHGKLAYEDAVPGVGFTHGVCLDDRDDLYVLAVGRRVLDGKPYFNVASCTVMKASPGKNKTIGTGGAAIPVSAGGRTNRPPDLEKKYGLAWAEGAQWLYGGIGWSLKKGTGCQCSNARIALDQYARTFAPEIDRNSIAVLDTNGNLITRVGRYGNVEDGQPLVAAGGPPNPRSIGGDEVSLFYALYPAVQSDRRLFVADGGNYRIISIKLWYHAEEKLALKDVKDEGKK